MLPAKYTGVQSASHIRSGASPSQALPPVSCLQAAGLLVDVQELSGSDVYREYMDPDDRRRMVKACLEAKLSVLKSQRNAGARNGS